MAGCAPRATAKSSAPQLFDIIEPFADYAFNKSHAYGYGLVAYQTAWLKAHHPVEYMAALLTSVKDNKDKTAVFLAECRTMGIDVLVPDVNRSGRVRRRLHRRGRGDPDTWTTGGPAGAQGDRLRPGGGAQRGGEPGRADRHRTRGPRALRGHLRLLRPRRPVVLNKRTMESLVKAAPSTRSATPARGCA